MLATNLEVVICDELTSALDVSVQAAAFTTIQELQAKLGLSLLFITHDIGVVAAVADRVMVLKSRSSAKRVRRARFSTSRRRNMPRASRARLPCCR